MVSHPEVMIDGLFDMWTWALTNTSGRGLVNGVDLGIVVVMMNSAMLDFEFAASVSSDDVDVLFNVWLGALTDLDSDDGDMAISSASRIGDDMLTNVDSNMLVAMIPDLKFIVSSPLADSLPFF